MSMGPIVQRELRSLSNSPIAYVVILFFLVLGSVWFLFVSQFLYQNVASLRGYFSVVPILFIVVIPAVTMRSWAEEAKLGTSEILFTLPFRDYELVFGKFTASFALIASIAALTFPLPLTLRPLGDFQGGQIIGEYVGMLLLGAAGIAIGQFISALSTNQVSAFLASVALLAVLTLLVSLNDLSGLPLWAASILGYLSFSYHFASFDKGLLDSRDALYFALVAGLFLYLNVRWLSARKRR